MSDQDKTKEELINELMELRQKVSELEAALITLKQREKSGQEAEAISKPEDVQRKSGAPYKSPYSMMRLMCDNVPDLIWAKDLDGKFLFVNRAMCEKFLSARDTDEPIGKTDIFFADREQSAHPDNPNWHHFGEICVNSDQLVLTTRKPGRFDEFGNVKGEFLYLDVYKAPFWNEQGEMIGTVGCARVVTEEKRLEAEQKRAEEALRESEEKYRCLVEKAPVGILSVNREGRILEVNQQLLDILGSPSAEATKSINMLTFPPLVKAGLSDASRRCMETGENVNAEVPYTSKWGKTSYLRMILTPSRDPDGNVKGCQAVTEDITERKRAEEALTASEEKYRTLFEESFDGIFITSTEGKILDMNKKGVAMFGYNTKEEISRLDLERDVYAHPPDRKRILAMVNAQGSAEYEAVVKKKNGEEMITYCSLTSVRDQGGVISSYRGIIRDISDRKRVEIELQKLALVVHNSSEFIGLADLDGRLIFINEAGARMVGISPKEVGQYVIHEVVAESCQSLVKTEMVPQILEKGRWDGFLQLRHIETGELTDVQAMTFLIRDPDTKQPLYLANVSLDITEHKRALQALEESERMLKVILATSPIGIVLTKNRKIEWANDAFLQMCGFEDERECLGRNTSFLYLSEEEYEHAGEILYRDLGAGKVGETECKFRRKDGSVFEAQVKIRALDPLDPAEGAISAVSDISSRKRAEERQRLLATAVEQSVESIIISDASRNIQYVNPSFERISGYTAEEVIGESPRLLKSDKHDKAFYRQMLDTMRREEAWKGRIISKRKDGSLFYEDVTISPVRDEIGNVINYVDVGHEVTQQVLLQNQLNQAQKMEAIGTLAGGIAHDFNNILTVVLGFSELLLEAREESDPAYADLQKIAQAARNGADLVQGLLVFSRKAELSPRPLNLNRQVDQLKKMLSRTIPKMIEIELILADDLATVGADPTQVDQILMNLAVNARDAMPNGGKLTIETANVFLDEECVRLHPGAKPGHYVLLAVSDTGHGMEKEILQHVFEPFYTTKEVGKGTGLGLAMVYGIVTHHGGCIGCYSEPGEGTTFKIYLPVMVMEERESDRLGRETMPEGGNETILLVDDEKFIRDFCERILTRSGYKVVTARDGKKALNRFRKESRKISLVILDLMMPEMGGKECLEGLLKVDPQAKVLIATGYAAEGQTKDVMALGAKGFVGKPYEMRQLLQAVREVLDSD